MVNLFDSFAEYTEAEAKVSTGGLSYDNRVRVGKNESIKVVFLGNVDDDTKNHPVMTWSAFDVKAANSKRSLSFMVHDLEQIKKNELNPDNPDVGLLLHKYGGERWEKAFKSVQTRFYFLVYLMDKAGVVEPTLKYLDAPKSMVQGILNTYKAQLDAAKKYGGKNAKADLAGMVFKITANAAGTNFTVEYDSTVELDGEVNYDMRENLAFLASSPPSYEGIVAMLEEQFPDVYADYKTALGQFMVEQSAKVSTVTKTEKAVVEETETVETTEEAIEVDASDEEIPFVPDAPEKLD